MSAFMADAVERPSAEAKRILFARLAARFGNRFSTGTALRMKLRNASSAVMARSLASALK